MDGLIKFQRKDHMQNNSTNLSISKMKFSKEKVTAELSYKYLEERIISKVLLLSMGC